MTTITTRETMILGWDGMSQPIIGYRDERHLPDHLRTRVTLTNGCDTILRTGQCAMDANHRGRHTTVAFYCDYCGKRRRGSQPYRVSQQLMADGYYEVTAGFCFMCCVVDN